MGFLWFILITILMFRFLGSFAWFIFPFFLVAGLVSLFFHLWWVFLIVIPLLLLRPRRVVSRQHVKKNDDYDHDFREE
ncbi:hypothetical protein [Companilactobacillus sp. DQM5]|uniref:hypothetical protein n=1 Tax=Companilactobacillus sp. DQM5 TaxID=3463359 RepID=UPI0040587234